MKSRTERIEIIKSRVDAVSKIDGAYTQKVKYRETSNILPVIKLEIDCLGYRLENSRTIRQQQRYLRENPSLPNDFFDDPESNQAQKAQESILYNMVLNHKSFIADLKSVGQDEPALITYDGYLVNGNRRTAALKKLGYEYVDCAVLPKDVTAREIYQIEQDLQIAEDFKQDYDWINELLNIRSGKENIKYKLTEKQLAKNLKISPQALRSKLIRIGLVDSFLIWKGIPNQYDYTKLDDAEQAFKELEKGLKKFSDNIEKQNILKEQIFVIIENKPKKGRVYDHARDIIKDFDEIIAKLTLASEDDTIENEVDIETTLEDVLGDITDEDEEDVKEEEIKYKDIKKKSPLKVKPEDSKEWAAKLIEAKEDVKAEKKEERTQESVYLSISDSLRSLAGVSVQEDSTKLLESKKKLTELINTANSLLTDINNKIDSN